MNRIHIMGVGFDPVSPKQALDRVSLFLREEKTRMVVTPNPEMLTEAQNNKELSQALNNADLVLADGIGVIYAAKILGEPLNERVTGVDLMGDILNLLAKTGKSYYLFGAKEGYADKAAENIAQKYKGARCAGVQHGYFSEKEESKIIDQINDARPDVIFVGLGSPRQEIWAEKNRRFLNTKLIMCIGGAIDVFSGKVQRAPKWVSKIGFEWLYRAIKQPTRFKRLAKLPPFLFRVKSKSKK